MTAAADRPPMLWPVSSMESVLAGGGLLPGPVPITRTGPAELVDPPGPTAAAGSWPCHLERHGPRPRGGPWAVDAAAAAGLRGCGGGFFPAARKWRAALSGRGPVTVVANAAESEPLSGKDAALLQLRPHLVLDGLAILAETLDARAAVVWLHDVERATLACVAAAVDEHEQPGAPITIRAVPGGYLAGESSAIKRALGGGPLMPQFQGFGRPPDRSVLVQNAETLARLALVCRTAGAGRGLPPAGRPAPWRSRLLTVVTPTARRVVEAPAWTRLGAAVTAAAGGQPPTGSAVLLGGYGGAWARWSDVAGLPVDERPLREHGLTLGAGIVAPLWEDTCGVAATAAIAAYLARASAGQCGPCLFGLPAVAQALADLRDGHLRRRGLRRLGDDLAAIEGRGACHHPDGAVRLVRSALGVFADDVAAHAAGRPCGRPQTVPVPGPTGPNLSGRP